MTRSLRFPLLLLQLSFVGALALSDAPACQAQAVAVLTNAGKSHINFTVVDNLHTVHGSFQMKESKIVLDPAAHTISGSLIVDVRSGNSGSHARDQRMHNDILESERYPLSTFTAESMEGDIAPSGDSSAKVHGKLNIHGADHPVTLDVLIHREGNVILAKTKFGIPFVDWGMKDPSNFLFRLEKTVQMDVEISGSIQ